MTIPAELSASLARAHSRVLPAQIALALTAAVDLAAAISYKMQAALLSSAQQGYLVAPSEAAANDDRLNFATRAALVLMIVTGVVFLRWFYSAVQSARWLRTGAQASAGDAIGAFFMPFANLVFPYITMRELHSNADPSDLPLPSEIATLSGPAYRPEVKRGEAVAMPGAPMGVWWATYLGMTFISMVAGFIGTSRDLESLTSMSRVAAVGRACGVVSAVLCIVVIRAVDHRLVERARRQAAMDEDPVYSVGEES